MKTIQVRATGALMYSNYANSRILFPMAEKRSSRFTSPA